MGKKAGRFGPSGSDLAVNVGESGVVCMQLWGMEHSACLSFILKSRDSSDALIAFCIAFLQMSLPALSLCFG